MAYQTQAGLLQTDFHLGCVRRTYRKHPDMPDCPVSSPESALSTLSCCSAEGSAKTMQ